MGKLQQKVRGLFTHTVSESWSQEELRVASL